MFNYAEKIIMLFCLENRSFSERGFVHDQRPLFIIYPSESSCWQDSENILETFLQKEVYLFVKTEVVPVGKFHDIMIYNSCMEALATGKR